MKNNIIVFADYIPWTDISLEYKWYARNENGQCLLFKNKPRIENRCYWTAPIEPCYIEQGLDAHVFRRFSEGTTDWKTSLQERVDELL